MKTYAMTGLLEQDLKMLRRLIRSEFDTVPTTWDNSSLNELIEMADRMGFKDLANEMRADINLPTRESLFPPAIAESVE